MCFLEPNIFTGYVFKITCLGLSEPRSDTDTHPTGSCGPVTDALDLLLGVASTLLLLPGSGSAELLAAGSGLDCCPSSPLALTTSGVGLSDFAEVVTESDDGFLNHLRISIVWKK